MVLVFSLWGCDKQKMPKREEVWHSHLLAPRYRPASWLAQCTAQRPASQTCCTAWWRPQCPAHALWCPCGAGGPAECLSLRPQRFSYPGAAGGESKRRQNGSATLASTKQLLKQTVAMIILLHLRILQKEKKKKEKRKHIALPEEALCQQKT